jgi:hypothetical protein
MNPGTDVPTGDQIGIPEHFQMVGDSGLADVEMIFEMTDAQVAPGPRDQLKHAKPNRVSDGLETSACAGDFIRIPKRWELGLGRAVRHGINGMSHNIDICLCIVKAGRRPQESMLENARDYRTALTRTAPTVG